MPGLDALPVDPTSLAEGGLPGLDALPIDPTSLAGGGTPSLDALPIDPTSLAGDGIPGLDALPIDLASLAGGGDGAGANPIAPYVTQLTYAVDEFSADITGSDGSVDAVTDVIDVLAVDPTAIQASLEAIPGTLETAVTGLVANLSALSGGESGGSAPQDQFSMVLTTPAGVLTVDSNGPSFE